MAKGGHAYRLQSLKSISLSNSLEQLYPLLQPYKTSP